MDPVAHLQHQLEQARRENALLAAEVQRLQQINDLEAQVRHLRARLDAQDEWNKQVYGTLSRHDKELKAMAQYKTDVLDAQLAGLRTDIDALKASHANTPDADAQAIIDKTAQSIADVRASLAPAAPVVTQ